MDTLGPVTNLVPAMKCLFGFVSDGLCAYNIENPPVYFSLGEAVSAFGLIFAVYQLRKPSWEIILRIRPWWQRQLVWYLSGLGLLSIAFSSLVTQVPFYYRIPPPLDSPFFYELLGYMSFIAAPLSFFIFSAKATKLFSERNADRFFQTLLKYTARARQETIEATVNIVATNFSSLFIALKRLREVRRGEAYVKNTQEQYADYAKAVFESILGDSIIANYIVTARLDIIMTLLYQLKTFGIEHRHIHNFTNKLFECLYENPESYFYKQLDYGGLSFAASVYDAIFDDIYISNNFTPFTHWSGRRLVFEKQNNKNYLQVYLKGIEITLGNYLKEKRSFGYSYGVEIGFSSLKRYLESLHFRAYKHGYDSVSDDFSQIERFISNGLVEYKEACANDRLSVSDRDILQGNSRGRNIVSCFAELAYQFIHTLATVEDKDDMLRIYAFEATDHLVGLQSKEGDGLDGVRSEFQRLVWEQIDKNARGWYPAVLRIYLLIFGFRAEGDYPVLLTERNKLVSYLERVIKPKIIAGDKMADKDKTLMEKVLLPPSIEYNRETGKFDRIDVDGNHEPMEIIPILTRG